MANGARRLEQILRIYEDICLEWNAENARFKALKQKTPYRTDGGAANWKRLRNALLHIRPDMTNEELVAHIDPYRVWSREGISAELAEVEACLDWVPFTLSQWTRDSRRVFTLSHDLQTLLNATSLEGVTWDDIKMPFRSFVVTLAKPIIATLPPERSGMTHEFDTIVVCTQTPEGYDEKSCSFWALPNQIDSYRPISATQRRELEESVRRGNWHQVERFCRKELSNRWNPGFNFTIDSNFRSTHVSKIADSLDRPVDRTECDQVIRIIMGVCLYLKSLPATSSHVSSWKNDEILPTDRGACVTEEAKVCTVSTQFKLSTRERVAFERNIDEVMNSPSYTLSPHFRRGFWHRPRGKGNDPAAPKTEWTRPTIVNEHLLKDGELPKGASTILLS